MEDRSRDQVQNLVKISSNIKTLLIACSELEDLPGWSVRKNLGAYSVLRRPAALVEPEKDRSLLIELSSRTQIKNIVLCAHSLCKYFQKGSRLKVLELSKQAELLSKNQKQLYSWFCKQGRSDIELHSWLYEPEAEWISALDDETGIFVPLNACTRLYASRLSAAAEH